MRWDVGGEFRGDGWKDKGKALGPVEGPRGMLRGVYSGPKRPRLPPKATMRAKAKTTADSPKGNDRKKSNDKRKGKYKCKSNYKSKSRSFALLRMINVVVRAFVVPRSQKRDLGHPLPGGCRAAFQTRGNPPKSQSKKKSQSRRRRLAVKKVI